MLGLLTALGADASEIASASSALFSGAREVGVGVIVGSNLFNLAALLGLPENFGRAPLFPRMVPLVDGRVNLVRDHVGLALLLYVAGLLVLVCGNKEAG